MSLIEIINEVLTCYNEFLFENWEINLKNWMISRTMYVFLIKEMDAFMLSSSSILRFKYNAKAEAQKSQKAHFLAAFWNGTGTGDPIWHRQSSNEFRTKHKAWRKHKLKPLRCSINSSNWTTKQKHMSKDWSWWICRKIEVDVEVGENTKG